MSYNNEEINLTDIVVVQQVIADQNETNHIVDTTNCRDEGWEEDNASYSSFDFYCE